MIRHSKYKKPEAVVEGIKDDLKKIALRDSTPKKYGIPMLEAWEVICQLQREAEWIPCCRELPGAWDIDPDMDPEDIIWPEYNVTIIGASEATTLHYDFQEDTWFDDNGYTYDVVAWRPMPEAYRPEQHPGQKSVGDDYKQRVMERFLKVE